MGDHVDVQALLLRSIESGDCSHVEFLLRNGAEVNSQISLNTRFCQDRPDIMTACQHDAPLHVAVRSGNLEMVRALLDHSADVNLPIEYGLTPLHVAAEIGQVDMVELLLDRGANVYAKSCAVISPFHLQTEDGTIKIKAMKRSDQKVGGFCWKNCPLPFAASFGHLNVVEILLVHHEKLSASGEYDSLMETFIKRAALECAFRFRQPEVVELLLKKGANPFDIFCSQTAGHKLFETDECCSDSHLLKENQEIGLREHASLQLKVLDVLLMSGQFNPNSLDSRAETPLHQTGKCCQRHRVGDNWTDWSESPETNSLSDNILKKLLEYGADVNLANCKGETALMLAAKNGCDHFIRILLDWTKTRGIKLLIDMRDELGHTALLKAITSCRVNVVKLLVKNGASVNINDNRGFTALHLAHYEKYRSNFDADGSIHEYFRKRLHDCDADTVIDKREIAEIILESVAAQEQSGDSVANTPLDLAGHSKSLTDELPSEGKSTQNALLMSTNRRRFQRFDISDWECSSLRRFYMTFFTKDTLALDGIITKEMKDRTMTSASHLHTEKLKHPAPVIDDRGRTALHYAGMRRWNDYQRHDLAFIEMLLNAGPSINAVDNYGRTPLHYASQYKGAAKINSVHNWLVKHGADEQIRDKEGHTPKYLKELHDQIEELNVLAIHKFLMREESSNTSTNWQKYIGLRKRQKFVKRLENLAKHLERFGERLAIAIGERDHRFTCESKLVGSAADGTKIDIPGDFDFDLTLTELSKRCEVHQSPVAPSGFVRLKRKGYSSEHILYRRKDDLDSFFNEEHLLLVNEVNCWFKELVKEILHDSNFWRNDKTFELQLYNDDECFKSLHTRIRLQMIHPIQDEFGDLCLGSLYLDIVPCIHLDNWWPEEALDNVASELKSFGCNLVFDSPLRSCPWVPFAETYVRISFAPAEAYIMQHSSALLKAAYSIAKILCSQKLFRGEPELKNGTYALKSSFLYCIEAFNNSTAQEPLELSLNSARQLYSLAERILFCFVKFCDQDFLPCYFMPSFSLPVYDHLKSRHLQCIINDDMEEMFISDAHYIYNGFNFSRSETQLDAENPSVSEKGFSKLVIQSLLEKFNRDAFMTKLSKQNSSVSGTSKLITKFFENIVDQPIQFLEDPLCMLIYFHLTDQGATEDLFVNKRFL